MKRLILAVLLSLIGLPAFAQTDVRIPLAVSWDLDGEAADADQVVAGPDALADSTNYVVDANPDSCRLIDMTLVDADSSTTAGVLTMVGTGCLGEAATCTYTFDASGSGVKTFTSSQFGGACYLRTVATVATGVLTGEGADTITIGYTSNSVAGYHMYGQLLPPGPNDERGVDFAKSYEIILPMTTSGVLTTAVTSVAANACFSHVLAGDILIFNLSGTVYERKVAVRTSDDAITLNLPVNIPAAGVGFRYKRAFFTTNPYDGMWIPVRGYKSVLFSYNVAANASTGGVVVTVECTSHSPGFPLAPITQIDTDTVATTATGSASFSVDLGLAPFELCRIAASFGTGDDADAAVEQVTLLATLSK